MRGHGNTGGQTLMALAIIGLLIAILSTLERLP